MEHINFEEYIKEVKRTESIRTPIANPETSRLIHGAMGLSTESGEILDAVKAYLFYGKKMDIVNILEEVGDIMWYVAIILDTLDTPLAEVLRMNVLKLATRYPEGFKDSDALGRDLNAERSTLEDKGHASI